MRYIDVNHTTKTFSVETSNKLINANITNIHTEYTLEDNSMLIFSNDDQYYDFIGDAEVYSSDSINIDYLIDKDDNLTDVCSNFSYNGADVLSVTEINYGNAKLYYLIRSGYPV